VTARSGRLACCPSGDALITAFDGFSDVAMNYMLLMIEPPEQRRTRTRAEGEAVFARMLQFAEELKAQGVLRGVESLAAQSGAARVQVRAGKPRVVDGPFAEAKEMIGGFYLIDVPTRDAAIAIAQRCPAAEWATVEVRALGPCYDESVG
jgi:hypothetical protein